MDSTEVFREEERNLAATLAKVHEALARATRVSESTNDARRETKFYLSANRGEIDPQEMQQHATPLVRGRPAGRTGPSRPRTPGEAGRFPLFRPGAQPRSRRRRQHAPSRRDARRRRHNRRGRRGSTRSRSHRRQGPHPRRLHRPLLVRRRRRHRRFRRLALPRCLAVLRLRARPGFLRRARRHPDRNAGRQAPPLHRGRKPALRVRRRLGHPRRGPRLRAGKTSDNAMRTIVASIQREQNAVIRDETTHTLVIQGVAGSGKTSIALHRVAYLLYRRKGSLSARSVAVLSPNKVFGDYIAGVLPELGEEPIQETGLRDVVDGGAERRGFRRSAALPHRRRRRRLAKARPLQGNRAIRRRRGRLRRPGGSRPAFVAEDLAFGTYVVEKERLHGAVPTLRKPAHRRAHRGRGRRRDGGTAREAHRAPLRPAQEGGSEAEADRHAAREGRTRPLPPLSTPHRRRAHAASAREEHGGMGRRLRVGVLPERASTDGSVFSDVQHLVVDEMQDLTPIQHRLVARLFPCEKTILGDIGQAVDPRATA